MIIKTELIGLLLSSNYGEVSGISALYKEHKKKQKPQVRMSLTTIDTSLINYMRFGVHFTGLFMHQKPECCFPLYFIFITFFHCII